MRRRRMLAVCGTGLAAVAGCVFGEPAGETVGDGTGNARATPTTDAVPRSTTDTSLPGEDSSSPTPSSSPSSSPASSSPLVGNVVSGASGERVAVPFALTNTGSDAIDPEQRVIDVDLAYVPALQLADDANVYGTWTDDFEDVTAWTPPDRIEPGETVTARLPAAVGGRASGLYALRATAWQIDATGTAHLRVSPVPRKPDIVLRARGGLGGFTSTGPPASMVVDEPVCPADTARVLVYLRNVAETAAGTVDVSLRVPDGWDVGGVTHAERWQSADTRWRFRDVAPGRYRWSRVDLDPPSSVGERTTYSIGAAGSVAGGPERIASATVVVDPNKDAGLTGCET